MKGLSRGERYVVPPLHWLWDASFPTGLTLSFLPNPILTSHPSFKSRFLCLLIFWSSDLLIFWSSFRYSCHLMFLISLPRLNKNSQVLPPKLSGNPIHLMNHSYRMKFMFFWCSFFHSSNEDFSSPSLKMGCWCFEVSALFVVDIIIADALLFVNTFFEKY